ncbi:MAG: hypothetical protein NZ768_03950, partial [Pseudomonadales bacterium]|nr:hypothetical protein [Pseudomonadales bacterium]
GKPGNARPRPRRKVRPRCAQIVFSTIQTPLDLTISGKHPETVDLLRKHGGKTGEELKAEGK